MAQFNNIADFTIVTAQNINGLGIKQELIKEELSSFYIGQSDNCGDSTSLQGMQLFDQYAHNWRAILSSDGQIMGFWFFVALRDDVWDDLLNGQLDEDTITDDMIEFTEFPGTYNGYMLCSSIKSKFRTPAVTHALFNSFAKYLFELANEGIFFSKIAGTASSRAGVSTVRGLGMKEVCKYCKGGNVYCLDMREIGNVPLYAKIAGLTEYYNENFATTVDDYISSPSKRAHSKEPEIFISYSSKESIIAKQICDHLESNGIQCWIAPRNVDPGRNYATQIVQAIRNCSILVLLASNNTNASGHVSNEVSLAFDSKKIIIPFKIEDISFSDEYLYFLGRKHWIEAHRDMSKGFAQLVSTIQDVLGCSTKQTHTHKGVPEASSLITKQHSTFTTTNIDESFKKYIKKTFLPLIDNKELFETCKHYAAMFGPISVFKHHGKKRHIEEDLFETLIYAINHSTHENIIKITGNNGCDKNALMQLLFLRIYNDTISENINYIPMYINLPYYEKQQYTASDQIYTQIKSKIDEDLKPFLKNVKESPEKQPIIFIDGIRDCAFSKTFIEHIVAEKLSCIPNLQKIVSVDTNFTINKKRQKKVIALAPANFEYTVDISAVDLVDDELCSQFFDAFENTYDIKVKDLHNKIKALSFYEIDAYILRHMANIIRDNLHNTTFSISDLYEALCMEMFNGNREALLNAAKTAYNFSYNEVDFDDYEVFAAKHWTVIKRHKSIVDYLISYYYIHQLTEYETNWDLRFFELVLPKEVTRFITPKINDNYGIEEKIVCLCEQHYDDFGHLGKSEMTFWLGRIKNTKLAEKAKQLLIKYYNETNDIIRDGERFRNINDLKDSLFLLRGITVSLIYKGMEKIAEDYICHMIDNDIVNEINRGFHLEYYGDKAYMPNKNMLDFNDNVAIGNKTLQHLAKNIENHLEKRVCTPVLELDLFTMCSLLQARISSHKEIFNYPFSEYIQKCIHYLNVYNTRIKCLNNKKITLYFNMVLADFKLQQSLEGSYAVSSYVYNSYSKAVDVKRTGWVELDIPDPESIVEHMYNTWLLGMLNLPESHCAEGYDKARILSMIMVHDLGETVTGDIPKPKKKGRPEYDDDEDRVMNELFLKGTYPDMPNLKEYFELWNEWYEQITINSRIAKDLDLLQAMYQFCTYYTKYPDKFSDERRESWLNEHRDIKTELGLQIYERIIKDNPQFRHLF